MALNKDIIAEAKAATGRRLEAQPLLAAVRFLNQNLASSVGGPYGFFENTLDGYFAFGQARGWSNNKEHYVDNFKNKNYSYTEFKNYIDQYCPAAVTLVVDPSWADLVATEDTNALWLLIPVNKTKNAATACAELSLTDATSATLNIYPCELGRDDVENGNIQPSCSIAFSFEEGADATALINAVSRWVGEQQAFLELPFVKPAPLARRKPHDWSIR